MCELFDQLLLDGCAWYEPDKSKQEAIWDAQKAQNHAEAVNVNAIVARFYHLVKATKCKKKKNCTGAPVMLHCRQGISKEGQLHFIGCSEWNHEGLDHTYIMIPPNVGEDELKNALETDCLVNPVNVNPKCLFAVHPRVGNKKDCHT
ncbi:hypothetical protein K439DRAFT_1618609 [Ramaria rubella]|nr:hypothetical protein K439DRAFT_1618609 [Ramaria rubella]